MRLRLLSFALVNVIEVQVMLKCDSSCFLSSWSIPIVEASRPRDLRGCQVDACFQPRMISSSVNPVKDVRTGCPDTPSDGFVSHSSEDQYATPFSESNSLPFSLREDPFYSVRSSAPLFNGGKTFWLVMLSLRWWQNHHHPAGGCQKSWEVTCHYSYPFALQAVECRLW